VGRLLIYAGIVLIVLGTLITFGVRLGRLPGDLVFRGKNTTFYFPVVTCVVLTLLSWLFSRR
jgi:hypothetical protein